MIAATVNMIRDNPTLVEKYSRARLENALTYATQRKMDDVTFNINKELQARAIETIGIFPASWWQMRKDSGS